MTDLTHEDLARGLTPDPDDLSSILFFHGKESGPYGSKYRSLRQEFSIDSPDFQGMDIWERLDKAEDLTKGMRNLIVVGSSYGGLLAAMLYAKHPQRFTGYVLAAPAFYGEYETEMAEIDKVPSLAAVVHGTDDEIVPLESVREFCQRHSLELTEVEDGHRLRNHHDTLIQKVRDIQSGQ